jgi:hypothetical protein
LKKCSNTNDAPKVKTKAKATVKTKAKATVKTKVKTKAKATVKAKAKTKVKAKVKARTSDGTRKPKLCTTCNKMISYSGFSRHKKSCVGPGNFWKDFPVEEHVLYKLVVQSCGPNPKQLSTIVDRDDDYDMAYARKDRLSWVLSRLAKARLKAFTSNEFGLDAYKQRASDELDLCEKTMTSFSVPISKAEMSAMVFACTSSALEIRLTKRYKNEDRQRYNYTDCDYSRYLDDYEEGIGMHKQSTVQTWSTRDFLNRWNSDSVALLGLERMARVIFEVYKDTIAYFPSLDRGPARYSYYTFVGHADDIHVWKENSGLENICYALKNKLWTACIEETQCLLTQGFNYTEFPDIAVQQDQFLSTLFSPAHERTVKQREFFNLIHALILFNNIDEFTRFMKDIVTPIVQKERDVNDRFVHPMAEPSEHILDSRMRTNRDNALIREVFHAVFMINIDEENAKLKTFIDKWNQYRPTPQG